MNEMYKSGSAWVVPYTSKDSLEQGITGLTVKFSIYNVFNGMYWDNASGLFDSVAEVLNLAFEEADGYYEYQLSAGYTAGEGPFRIHTEATETATGDIADFTELNDGSIADVKEKTENLPHSVKKNTAIPDFKFIMLDSATGNPTAGFSVTATRKLDADASWAAMTGSKVDNGDGAYSIDINAADTNGDAVIWKFTAPGAKTTFITFVTEAL